MLARRLFNILLGDVIRAVKALAFIFLLSSSLTITVSAAEAIDEPSIEPLAFESEEQLNQIFKDYLSQKNIEQKKTLGFQLIDYYEKNNQPEKLADILIEQTTLFIDLENYERADQIAQKAINVIDNHGLKFRKYDIMNRASEIYWSQGKLDLALQTLENTLDIAKNLKDQEKIASTIQNIGLIYRHLGDAEKSLTYYLEAIKIKKEIGVDNKSIADVYNNIGVLYFSLDKNELAEESFNKSMEALANVQDANLAKPLHNLGKVYEKREDYQTALYYFKESLNYENLNNNQNGYIISIRDLGRLHLKLNDINLAEKYISEAYQLSQNFDSMLINAETAIAYADFLSYKNQPQKAIDILIPAIEVARQARFTRGLKDAYFLIYQQYDAISDHKNALHYYKLFHETELSITADKAKQHIAKLEMEKEIALSKESAEKIIREKELQQLLTDKELSSSRITLIISIIVFITIVSLLIIIMLKKSVRQKEKLNEELLKLDKLKDRLLSSTSHELLTPINGVIGLSQSILFGDEALSAETRESLRIVSSCGTRLANLVKNILDLSSLQRQQLKIHLSRIDLKLLITDTMVLIKPLADEKELKLVESYPETSVYINVDPSKIEQILFNIIGNAIKYTDEGEIFVKLIDHDKEIQIEVHDSGIGIDEDQAEAIYSAFSQIYSDGFNRGGAGLGLTISKELIELHQGKITFENIPDGGSLFVITLPKFLG
ncbi:MAG: tetratricopeptide repeat-containing sensor histidine kinase [Gammaproteobacteria bacterium]|nr:tetratricopeptide repeat-containing sensor histidine kinase [Gammaproteobacteria bacterium]MDH5629505.1 tetratricopeptide repeat-containing sensor histidine kinase [Gammaproteobacteria bacterium]